MRKRLSSLALLCLLSTFSVACQDEVTAPPGTGAPSYLISDANHGVDPNPGFFWLSPLVAQPSQSDFGTFAPGLRPSVQLVCVSSTRPELPCGPNAPAIAEFGIGSGLLVEDDSHYLLQLETAAYGLVPSSADETTVYRLLVLTDSLSELGGPFVLGFADLQIGANGREAKNLATDEVIGLVDGRTLPVKFRIDQGAYEHEIRIAQASAPDDPDGPLCQENCTLQVVPADQQTEVSLADANGDEATGVLFRPGDLATTSVVVIDERTTDGEAANCATGVMIDKRFCYRYRVFPDVPFVNEVRFGICPRDLPIGPGSYWRLFKVDFIDARPVVTRPEMVDVSDFLPCTDTGDGAIGALRRAARYALDLIAPPLHAAFAEKVWGGMARDFSDMFWAEDAEMTPLGSADTTVAPGTMLTRGVLLQAMNWEEPTVALAGAHTEFSIAQGTGSLAAPEGVSPIATETAPDGRIVRMTLATSSAGEAHVLWTVGGGANALEVQSPRALTADGEPVEFRATGVQPELGGNAITVNNYQLALGPDRVGPAYFRGSTVLFSGSIGYGTDGTHVFINDTRGTSDSFEEAGIAPFEVEAGPLGDHYTAALMVEVGDQRIGTREHLEVLTVRETFAWQAADDADFLILRYTLHSTASGLDQLHLGFITDTDLGGNTFDEVFNDFTRYDAGLGAAVTSDSTTGLLSAYVLLDRPVTAYRHWVVANAQNTDAMRDPDGFQAWFDVLSSVGSDQGQLGPSDIRSLLATDPVAVQADASTSLTVALVAGEDAEALSANIAAARARFASAAPPPVVVHTAFVDLLTAEGGYEAQLVLPAGAGDFVASDARCGNAPLQVQDSAPTEGGVAITVHFSEPTVASTGRIYCSGRLADGSFFSGWVMPGPILQ